MHSVSGIGHEREGPCDRTTCNYDVVQTSRTFWSSYATSVSNESPDVSARNGANALMSTGGQCSSCRYVPVNYSLEYCDIITSRPIECFRSQEFLNKYLFIKTTTPPLTFHQRRTNVEFEVHFENFD